MRSDSIQDLSLGRDSDRFSSTTKHVGDSYLRVASAGSSQTDTHKDMPAAAAAGVTGRNLFLVSLCDTRCG